MQSAKFKFLQRLRQCDGSETIELGECPYLDYSDAFFHNHISHMIWHRFILIIDSESVFIVNQSAVVALVVRSVPGDVAEDVSETHGCLLCFISFFVI